MEQTFCFPMFSQFFWGNSSTINSTTIFFHVFHGFDTGWVSSKRRLEDLAADAGPKAPPSPAREPRGSLASPARWSERLDVNTKRLAKILRSCAMDESSDSS